MLYVRRVGGGAFEKVQLIGLYKFTESVETLFGNGKFRVVNVNISDDGSIKTQK